MCYNILEDNQADHGGGLYRGYYDNVYNNSIEMSYMIITNNSNTDVNHVGLSEDRGGGGVKIVHASMYSTIINQLVNKIEITSCNISNNTDIICSGLMIDTSTIFNLHLVDIVFVGNITIVLWLLVPCLPS